MRRILVALIFFCSILSCANAKGIFADLEATQEERKEIEQYIAKNEKELVIDIHANEYANYKLGRIIKVYFVDCKKYVSCMNLDDSKCKDVYEADYFYYVEIIKENGDFIRTIKIDKTPSGLRSTSGSLNKLFLFKADCEEIVKSLAAEYGMEEIIDAKVIDVEYITWIWITDGDKEYFIRNDKIVRQDPNSKDEEVWIPIEGYTPVLWDQSRFLENCKSLLDRYDSKWIVSDDEPGGKQKAGSNTSRFIYVMSSIGIMMIIVPVVILLLKKKRDRTDICL